MPALIRERAVEILARVRGVEDYDVDASDLRRLAASVGRGHKSPLQLARRDELALVVAELLDGRRPVNAAALARVLGLSLSTVYYLRDHGRTLIGRNASA